MNIPGLPAYVTFAFIASIFLITVAIIVRKSLKLVPGGTQNFVETVIDSILDLSVENMGRKWGEMLFPLMGTLFLYILVCNFFGLIPGFDSPTANINATAACAVPVFFATHYYGIKVHKFKYINHFLGPIRSIIGLPLMLLMFVIEIIGHLVRPVTLSVRLFGNMMAKHILLGVLVLLAPIILPTLVLALGTLVSLIQAFVFTLLAVCYLAGAVEEAH
ncbi:MAG TPA: ATP synthase F0 subunit A [Nitrospirae bacterium]|nr:ATP synthase F0 subunit A [Nitrospirota bacterium]HDO36085.1 ATP synthase F0 subunit A [Nitrospirota bacterium]HDZ88915.1 ATP synthase F0 subunit A [Nitrospirota bacterium]